MDDSSDKEVFELMLREISIQAFDALLNCGVRDIAGFLHLTEETLCQSGISQPISIELMDIKWKLCAQSEDYYSENRGKGPNISIDNDFREGQRGRGDGLLRQGTPIPLDLEKKISTRARNVLIREKILTCERLLELTESDLLSIAQIGKNTLAEIKALQLKTVHAHPTLYNRTLVDVTTLVQPKKRGRPTKVVGTGIEANDDCHSDLSKVDKLIYPHVTSAYHPASSKVRDSDINDWSILSHTLPDLFQVSPARYASSNDEEMTLIASLGISPSDIDQLAQMIVFPEDPAEDLFSMSVGYLLQSGISDNALSIILDHLAVISGRSSQAQLSIPTTNLSDVPIYANIQMDLIEDLLVSNFSCPDIFVKNQYVSSSITWGDLASITERMIIARLGFTIRGVEAIKALWSLKDRAVEILNDISRGLPAEAYSSFEQLIDTFVRTVGKKNRDFSVLKGRLGLLDGRKWTLEELGQHENVSRERIRQIEKQLMNVLLKSCTQKRLCRLWITVEEILASGGGACCAAEITASLARRWKWPSAPSDVAIASLLSLSSNYEVVWESPILIIMPQHKCVSCSAIRPVLIKEIENQPDGTLSFDRADLIIKGFCHKIACVGTSPVNRFSKGFLHFLDNTIEEIVADETTLYTQYAWAQKSGKHGSGSLLVETILRNGGRPMHFTEVQAEVNMDRPAHGQLSERDIYGYIGRSPDLLLWGRGTFIHRDYFLIPCDLIAKIENEIFIRLQEDIPYLSVSGIFDFHKKELIEKGVPTESALYTCLKESNSKQLAYPDYPYIRKGGVTTPRVPLPMVLEAYVLEKEGVIKYDELRDYAVGKICMNEAIFNMHHLPNTPNLLLINNKEYIHLHQLGIEKYRIEPIVDHLRTILGASNHVSVTKLYADKKISCRLLGITTSIFLYSLLQHFYDGEFILSRYPKICLPGSQENWGSKRLTSVTREIVDYIYEKGTYCSLTELFSHFVDKLGYKQLSVYNAQHHERIVRYSDGVIVHIDTLAWNEENQAALELLASTHLNDRENAGKPYGLISHLYEYMHDQLPKIPSQFSWTQTLVGELLTRKEEYRILGIQRNAYVSATNSKGIENLDDLLSYLLDTNYDGAANLDLFISDMREAGILIKKLTPMMLGVDSRVFIDGNVVRLAKLSGHVTGT